MFMTVLAARAGAGFERKPEVKREGAKTTISFSVDSPTDVAVSVVDADGKVVRHLAAGVLGGERPPPLPLKPGLSQRLEWDGRDDYGREVPRVGFQVSVRPRELRSGHSCTLTPSRPRLAYASRSVLSLSRSGTRKRSGSQKQGGKGEQSERGHRLPAIDRRPPLSIRVALGLKPEFAGFMLFHPDALGTVYRVAVGPKGHLYYFYDDPSSNGNMGGHKIKVRDRDGRHVRTLSPLPADLTPEERKPFQAFSDEDGHVVPQVHNYEMFALRPVGIQGRAPDMACHTPAVDSKGRLHWIVRGDRLACVDAEGRCPYPTYLSKPLFPGAKYSRWRSYERYAGVSSDDRFLYISSFNAIFRDPKTKKDVTRAHHCVYRVDLETRAAAKAFVGDPLKAGGGETLLRNPKGVTSANGLLYVADSGNNRVVAFKESDGSFAGELKTPGPVQVAVNAKSGAVYVLAEPAALNPVLLKFAGLDAKEPTHRMSLGGRRKKSAPFTIALDAGAEPARVYFPSRGRWSGPWAANLSCLEETAKSFKRVALPKPKGRFSRWHKDLTIDQARDELYVKTWYDTWTRFDANTGEFKKALKLGGSGPGGNQVAVTRDGRIVMYNWVHKNSRPALSIFDHDGKRIAAPKGKGWSGVMTFQQKFLDVHGNEIYVVPGSAGFLGKKGASPHCVNVFDMELKPKRTVIWQCSDGCVVKTDLKGNIYLGENVRPLKRTYPEFFDGKLTGGKHWYTYMYGSIVKFSPKGGAVWFKEGAVGPSALGKPGEDVLAMPKQPFNFRTTYRGPRPPGQLQGAEWVRFGFAPYSSTYGGGTSNCQCEGSGFDIDGFGRVFYPNLGRFRVEVVDNNNNFIGAFGRYGNADSQCIPTGSKDGKPIVATPGIPFAWPHYVAAGDHYAYVGDLLAARVAKVKLGYAVVQTCPLD